MPDDSFEPKYDYPVRTGLGLNGSVLADDERMQIVSYPLKVVSQPLGITDGKSGIYRFDQVTKIKWLGPTEIYFEINSGSDSLQFIAPRESIDQTIALVKKVNPNVPEDSILEANAVDETTGEGFKALAVLLAVVFVIFLVMLVVMKSIKK